MANHEVSIGVCYHKGLVPKGFQYGVLAFSGGVLTLTDTSGEQVFRAKPEDIKKLRFGKRVGEESTIRLNDGRAYGMPMQMSVESAKELGKKNTGLVPKWLGSPGDEMWFALEEWAKPYDFLDLGLRPGSGHIWLVVWVVLVLLAVLVYYKG